MRLTALLLVAFPIVLALYSYAVYPAVLWFASRRPWTPTPTPKPDAESYLPLVTVVVPAYNEETQIRGAIEALLAQTYPQERLHILILSDASTDATDSIVAEYASRGVELLRMPTRSGKTAAENAAIRRIRGEVVVNSDASTRLHRDAVRIMVAHLADPSVGVASGRDISVAAGDGAANTVEAGYVNYEMRLRALETLTGGIVGASGCCYAIRYNLHRLPIPPDLSRDFSAPLTAREHGLRAVSVDDAVAFVPRTNSLRMEYNRKVRTVARGMETLLVARRMLNPMVFGGFAWKLISHKVCRWLVPLVAVPAAAALLVLAISDLWARAALGGAAVVLAVALAGALWPPTRRIPRVVSVVSFGVAANVAVVHGFGRLLRADDDKTWEPTRRDAVVLPE
jgi:cellulose synthase/poly-beta-1,6-N-acetylglucosamine synthase-like glycosyltransferase